MKKRHFRDNRPGSKFSEPLSAVLHYNQEYFLWISTLQNGYPYRCHTACTQEQIVCRQLVRLAPIVVWLATSRYVSVSKISVIKRTPSLVFPRRRFQVDNCLELGRVNWNRGLPIQWTPLAAVSWVWADWRVPKKLPSLSIGHWIEFTLVL